MNIDKLWPWKKDTFDQVWANHVFEHGKDKLHLIRELWRVCKPGAFVQVRMPIWSWTGFYDDITHSSEWTPESFSWFIQGNPHHGALPFKDIEFRQEWYGFRDHLELAWDLVVVKPGIPDSAEPRIEVPQYGATH